ncbi:AraC family transcriptional regulator, transcriptional activator of pobA [Roseateles sp. YR242]|uniref:helix-turn-helix domain-containing protein n=1 Tax=Roseateles sp. YR242 TaxID=1855305 RepID=UPI0008CA0F66|nr:helix-turn-helix domain-containing protein [Roseateles sp. YR242]SEK61813.1 AraC family transcriptional regulator, transcriptional activator of pobA [Roseateles sp. YR242]
MTHLALAKHPGLPQPEDRGAPATVPKVRLYVERPEQQDKWFVNVGHVTDRGRWRTEPHAHPGYGQIIFIRIGRGLMNLEGRSVPFEGPCALLLPTDCVHGLDYDSDVDKWVITVEVSYLSQVNAKLPEFTQLWNFPRIIAMDQEAEAAEMQALIAKLDHEAKTRGVGHVVATEAVLTELLLALVRGTGAELVEADTEGATRTATRLAERFRDLIDQHYRENLRLQHYASVMAVSENQLRAACVAATGLSPNKLIHARIITEAKRSLIFSDMTIEQIAYWLGFSDTAYFTRFFRKEVGQSPSQFRAAARAQPHGGR